MEKIKRYGDKSGWRKALQYNRRKSLDNIILNGYIKGDENRELTYYGPIGVSVVMMR